MFYPFRVQTSQRQTRMVHLSQFYGSFVFLMTRTFRSLQLVASENEKTRDIQKQDDSRIHDKTRPCIL